MFLSRVAVLLLLSCACVEVWSQTTCQDVVGQSRASNGIMQGVFNIHTSGTFAEVSLELKMAVFTYKPSLGFGSIQIDGGKAKIDDIARQAALNKQQILPYLIIYPPTGDVPIVLEISINGQVFCRTPQPSTGVEGIISLNYRLQTGGTTGVGSGSPSLSFAPQETTLRPTPRRTTTQRWLSNRVSATTQAPVVQRINGGEEYSCGVPSLNGNRPNSLIHRADATVERQWPWHAALYTNKLTKKYHTQVYTCGGTLISTTHVITAAHCVRKDSRGNVVVIEPKELTVILGRHKLQKTSHSQSADVVRIISHPQYNDETFPFDIALIILDEGVNFNKYVLPICLWDKSLGPLQAYQRGTVVGWGVDENGNYGQELKMATIPIIPKEECLKSDVFYQKHTTDYSYCAGDHQGATPCNGDSGGGMYFYMDNSLQRRPTWYLKGIVSISQTKFSETTGAVVCDDEKYVVFTDVATLLNWIREELRKH